MKAVRIIIDAPVCSFRYPHFLVGRQATYDMPPPSTIYGCICSAAGELLDSHDLQFAYDFRYTSRGSDLEHQHILKKEKAKVNITVNPVQRDYLYDCMLTLYVTPVSTADYFRHPVFCPTLGRSQDLARISSVKEIDLPDSDGFYLENTLLPFAMRAMTHLGVTVLMPRYIAPPPERVPDFERYLMLNRDIIWRAPGKCEAIANIRRLIESDSSPYLQLPIDKESPLREGFNRGLIFHTFTGEKHSAQ